MIKQKLQSKSGATIIVALLLFLVCAFAGSAVLIAATSNSGRLKDFESTQQSYYTVTSAAKLVSKEVNDMKITYNQGSYNEEPDSDLKKFLEDGFQSVYTNNKAYSTVLKVNTGTLSEVTCNFAMDTEYYITVSCSDDTYSCTLYIQAAVTKTSTGITVVWSDAKIEKN